MEYNPKKRVHVKKSKLSKNLYIAYMYWIMRSFFLYSLRTLSDRLITFMKEMEGFISVETGQSKKKEPEIRIADYPPSTKQSSVQFPYNDTSINNLQPHTQI